MTAWLAALVVAAAVGWGAHRIAAAVDRARADEKRARALALLTAFAPGITAGQSDARAYLVWQPLARTARALYPEEFSELDRAAGGPFPFSSDLLQAAHARWTAEWLAWENAHDAEFKGRAAEVAHDRARLDLVERERLAAYQRRYEEYIRVARALQGLWQT